MFRKRYSSPGSAPATLSPPPAATKPVLRITEYDETIAAERTVASVADLPPPFDDGKVRWIEMNGLGDVAALKALGEKYNLHPLALEDVLNLGQRPKVEPYGDQLFIIAQMIYRDPEDCLCGEQVSIFVCHGMLISIQEDAANDVFDAVRQRIRAGGGYIRRMKSDYLAYALLDAIVDNCFPVLEAIGESLEEVEEDVLDKPGRRAVGRIHNFKRMLMQLRRFVWPERDVVSALLHSEHPVVHAETKVFLRDLYDHTVQIMDLIESYRDLTTSLFEMYHSSVTLRTSEVMRVLTVMSSIFIPLTFIAGVYGMNFQPEPPANQPLTANMPELYLPYGYPACLALMAIVAGGLIYFFKKRKWL
jgi:magnesium transporter